MKTRIIAFAILIASFTANAQQVRPFEKDDKIAFVGNSITEAGFYESDIWLYYMTHFPEKRIEVFNKGVGGDVARQINDRFEEDVLTARPSVIVVTFGMNDSKYLEYMKEKPGEKVVNGIVKEAYDSYIKIRDKLGKLPAVTKVIMSSSPYDETTQKEGAVLHGKMATMDLIADFQKKSAEENHWSYVDLLHPMTVITQREQKNDPKYTITGPDRIHPGEEGHFVMAYLFLKAQGLDNHPVADVEVDSKKRVVVKQVNSKVSDLSISDQGLTFNYLSKSLPFPVDTTEHKWANPDKQSNALKLIPFIKEMNQEILKVTNLESKSYRLSIDDHVLGTFSATDLQQGINLAVFPNTPQYQQAANIRSLNRLRKETEDKLREYYWLQFDYLKERNMLYNDTQAALDTLHAGIRSFGVASKMGNYEYGRFAEVRKMWENDMKTLTDKIYTINKPVVHRIKLEAAK